MAHPRLIHAALLAFVISYQAAAKTKVDVPSFQDKTAATACNAVAAWKSGIEEAFKHQLIQALNTAGGFNVIESEYLRAERRESLSGVNTIHKKSTFKASQYSIQGTIKNFDVCESKRQNAEVVLQIKVIDNSSGEVAEAFTAKGEASGTADTDYKGAAFNTGLFKDSPIGQATQAAVAEAAAKLKRAFPEREVASSLKVQTIRKRGR